MNDVIRSRLATIFIDLVTPFDGAAIATAQLAAMVRWQIERGMHGFVIGGPIGEGAALTLHEKLTMAEIVRAQAGRHSSVLLCLGSNDTAATIAQIRQASEADVDAILLATPYYSRPTQAGLAAHLASVADGCRIPLILDDDPDRCGVQLSPGVLGGLAAHANIIGILDRRGDIRRCMAINQCLPGRYAVLGGQIETLPCLRLAGGTGVVSASAALVPSLCGWLISALRQDDYATAQRVVTDLLGLAALLTAEPSPQRLKAALWLQRRESLSPVCRMPAEASDPSWNELMLAELARLPRNGAITRSAPDLGHGPPDMSRRACERSRLQAAPSRERARP